MSKPPQSPCKPWPSLMAILVIIVPCSIAATRPANADEKNSGQPIKASRMKYVASNEQLIVELYVRDIKQSTAFYEQLGFAVVRKETDFVELGWEDSRLYLEQVAGQAEVPATVVANVRIMVSDVDRYWKLCQEMKLPVRRAIGDRYYGLRDFTVVAPEGIGLRFASTLGKKSAP